MVQFALMHVRRDNQALKWGDILILKPRTVPCCLSHANWARNGSRVVMNFSTDEVTLDLGEGARLIAGASSVGLMDTAPDALPAFSGVIAQV